MAEGRVFETHTVARTHRLAIRSRTLSSLPSKLVSPTGIEPVQPL